MIFSSKAMASRCSCSTRRTADKQKQASTASLAAAEVAKTTHNKNDQDRTSKKYDRDVEELNKWTDFAARAREYKIACDNAITTRLDRRTISSNATIDDIFSRHVCCEKNQQLAAAARADRKRKQKAVQREVDRLTILLETKQEEQDCAASCMTEALQGGRFEPGSERAVMEARLIRYSRMPKITSNVAVSRQVLSASRFGIQSWAAEVLECRTAPTRVARQHFSVAMRVARRMVEGSRRGGHCRSS